MTTFTNPHERIEQLMQERDAFAAELATAREHFDAVYSRNVYIEASLSSSKTRVQALSDALRNLHAVQPEAALREPFWQDVRRLLNYSQSSPSATLETDAAHASYIKTRDCEHDWQEIEAYPFREARCRKCGAGKTLPMGRYLQSEPEGK